MGLCLGFMQLVIYNNIPPWGRWIFLPLTGFFLGIVTNYGAIQACFRPLEAIVFDLGSKIKFLPRIHIQGLFLKRQEEVCYIYSSLLSRHFMNLPTLLDFLKKVNGGRMWVELLQLYEHHMASGAEMAFGKTISSLLPADVQFVLKEKFAQMFHAEFYKSEKLQQISLAEFDRMADVELTNARRMAKMSSPEFERLLHPIFEEDEWILILLGGVLGAIVGLFQVAVLGA